MLLYFYPKDNTPGCIKEACSFRDNFAELKKKLTILGVSADSVKSHKNFSDKYKSAEELNADEEKSISVADELIKLKKLVEEGVLTQDEFDKQKEKLLK